MRGVEASERLVDLRMSVFDDESLQVKQHVELNVSVIRGVTNLERAQVGNVSKHASRCGREIAVVEDELLEVVELGERVGQETKIGQLESLEIDETAEADESTLRVVFHAKISAKSF